MGFATSFGLNVRSAADLKNVFGNDSSDEGKEKEMPKDIVRFQLEQQRKRVEQEMKLKAAETSKQGLFVCFCLCVFLFLLLVDPTALEYDEVYDSMKKEDIKYQEKKQLKQSIRGKPKYVDKLIKEAEKRKLQNDLWYEKKLQREQALEQTTFGETEKFVTSSYKKHLEEVKKFEEQQQREEENNTAAGKAGMKGFYSNLLGFDSQPATKKQKPEEQQQINDGVIQSKQQQPQQQQQQPASAPVIGVVAEPNSSTVDVKASSSVLDLSSAVGVRDDGGEARRQQLEELNKTVFNNDKIEAAKLRMIQRKQQQQQEQLQ
jgi:coiled-coil domain-containing protein 55